MDSDFLRLSRRVDELAARTKADYGLGNVDNVKQLPMSYLDTDGTLAANSDVKVPSQKAVKTYADTKLAQTGGVITGALLYKDNPGTYRVFGVQSIVGGVGKNRWQWGAEATAESGLNAGSDFNMFRFADDGTNLGIALSISRATGVVSISSSAYNGGHLVMGAYHLWVDTTNRLRIKSGAPTSATDGTVVGSQS